MEIRTGTPSDLLGLVQLEEAVWRPKGVVCLGEDLIAQWLRISPEWLFVALEDGKVRGYAHHEVVYFDPTEEDSPLVQQIISAGHNESFHDLSGNALFGISVATHPPSSGTGRLLLDASLEAGAAHGIEYVLTLSRMPGFAAYVEEAKSELPLDVLVNTYVTTAMQLVGGSVAPHIAAAAAPHNLPDAKEPDPVMCRFAHIMGMQVHSIVPSSFPDQESGDLAALMFCSIPQR